MPDDPDITVVMAEREAGHRMRATRDHPALGLHDHATPRGVLGGYAWTVGRSCARGALTPQSVMDFRRIRVRGRADDECA